MRIPILCLAVIAATACVDDLAMSALEQREDDDGTGPEPGEDCPTGDTWCMPAPDPGSWWWCVFDPYGDECYEAIGGEPTWGSCGIDLTGYIDWSSCQLGEHYDVHPYACELTSGTNGSVLDPTRCTELDTLDSLQYWRRWRRGPQPQEAGDLTGGREEGAL